MSAAERFVWQQDDLTLASAAKFAQLAELEQLRGYLRHGNDPAKFQASALSPQTVSDLAKSWQTGDKAAFGRLRDALAR